MRSSFVLPVAAALLSVAGAANAVVVMGVYNTGVGANGAALAAGDGQVDPHYVVVSSNISSITAGSHALTYYNPAYLQDGPLSRIVNATGDANGATGEVTTFETTFNLTGYDATNATLSGQALFDNSGTVSLNGTQIASITGFGSLAPFGTNANLFVAGINHLDFTLINVDGPDAFQVAGLTVTAAPLAGAVPEPASWALMVAGFGLVGAAARRRKTTTVAA
jgi:hypothetical protein